jgi:RNA polymerase sigma factor (sigma-70 family)
MDGKANEVNLDATVWEGLEEMRGGLRSLLLRHCSDANDVEDVIQETFLRAARYRTRQRVQSLRSWTMKIALNVLADVRRRGQRAQALHEEECAFDPPERTPEESSSAFRVGETWLEGDSARELLLDALGGLRARDRELLDSYYGGSTRACETAVECGIPYRLVKVRLYRARKRLLRALRHKVAIEPRWERQAS